MTNAEHRRLTHWRMKLLEAAQQAGNVARTCRHFGISRKTFYKWRHRFEEHGGGGLTDRARAPHRSPRATPAAVVSKIVYLRQHYHFGPGKIADYLKRFHGLSVACGTVHRILRRHGMNRLPANQKYRRHAQRWTRYEKAQPGHRLQVDVKFLERIPGTRRRFYQFTAIDDCTRIRVLKVYDACNQRTAIAFIDEVLRRLPFRVHVVQTDNGAEFQSHFHWHLDELDIRHVYIRPRTPHLNGKVERSHRVDDQEFYQLLDKDGITQRVGCRGKSGTKSHRRLRHDRPARRNRSDNSSWRRARSNSGVTAEAISICFITSLQQHCAPISPIGRVLAGTDRQPECVPLPSGREGIGNRGRNRR